MLPDCDVDMPVMPPADIDVLVVPLIPEELP
jgi:hypothetical protein